MAHPQRDQQPQTVQQLAQQLEQRCRGNVADATAAHDEDERVWRAALMYAAGRLQQQTPDGSQAAGVSVSLAAILDHAGVSLEAFMRGLPAAAAHIDPHLAAVAQSAGAHTSITPVTAQAGLQVLPLQTAYVHASVLGRKLQEVLGAVLQPSADPAAATVADQQAITHCAWALYIAARGRQQQAPGGSSLAASFHTLLGAVAATAAVLPATWFTDGGVNAAALAAQHGAPAPEVEASAAQAGRLLTEATAAAAPSPAHNTRRSAATEAQLPQAAVIASAPGSAASILSAAAAWLEGQYAERCLGSGATGGNGAPGGDGSGSLGIDERGFAGWVPWRPAQQRAAATAVGEASPHPGWPSGAYAGTVAAEAKPGPGCANSCASDATAFPPHPPQQQQRHQATLQQPLEAAPEGAAAWLRHICTSSGEQGAELGWTPSERQEADACARVCIEEVFKLPDAWKGDADGEGEAAIQRREEALQLYHRLLCVLAEREGALFRDGARQLLGNVALHSALLAVACQLVVATHSLAKLSFRTVLNLTNADPFDAGRLVAPLLASDAGLPQELEQHLTTLEQRVMEELAWQPGCALYPRLAAAMGCADLPSAWAASESDDENERSHSPPRGSRAPLAPISRPDGGSPATPRKRGRNGQLVGPVPILMPPSDSAYERSDPPLRADGSPDSPPREAMLPTLVVASPMSPARRRAADRSAIVIGNSPPPAGAAPPPPPLPPLVPWAGPGATGGRIRDVGSGPFRVPEDPENVLPLPPTFGDPAMGPPPLPGGAPAGEVTPADRRLMADFLAKMLHLAAGRMAHLAARLPLDPMPPADFLTQAYTVAHFLVYQRTCLLFGRHLDQILLVALYATAKVHGMKQVTFKEILIHYRTQPQAASATFRTVPLLQDTGLRSLSSGDIIGFYNQIIIPAAKDFLHAMVAGKVPLQPSPVPLPPPGAAAAPQGGSPQPADSAAAAASLAATASTLGASAGLMTPRTRALIAAASSPINSPAPAATAAALDLAVDSQGGTDSPARIPQPQMQQTQGAAAQQRQQRSSAVRVSPRRGGRAAAAAAAAAASEHPAAPQQQQQQQGASPTRLGRAASLARATSIGLFRRAPSLAHGMGGDASDFGVAAGAAISAEAAAAPSSGGHPGSGAEALKREVAAELQALVAASAPQVLPGGAAGVCGKHPSAAAAAAAPPMSAAAAQQGFSPEPQAPRHALAGGVAPSPTRSPTPTRRRLVPVAQPATQSGEPQTASQPQGAETQPQGGQPQGAYPTQASPRRSPGGVPASTRAAQRLAAAAAANSAAVTAAASAADAAAADAAAAATDASAANGMPRQSPASPEASARRRSLTRPSAPGSPAARSVRRRLGI